jgi:hypothetical protein
MARARDEEGTMARKKKVSRKRVAAKKPARARIAERSLPKWRAVNPAPAQQATRPADAVSPSIAALRSKYAKLAGADAAAPTAGRSNPGNHQDDERSGLVLMEAPMPQDARKKRITVFVDKGRVKGVQG